MEIAIAHANRRSVRGFANVVARGRAKYAFFMMAAWVAAFGGLFLGLWMLVNHELALANDPVALPEVIRNARFLMSVAAMLLACGFAITVAVGVITAHRIYGPMVPLLRQIENFERGEFSARVQLRKGDELEELMTALNALGSALERRRHEERVRLSA